MKKLVNLFITFFKIGLFTFGGGYAMISLVQSEFVDKKKVVTSEEFMDMIAVSESTPGPIAINMATYIGYKEKGFLGSVISTLGVILPSFVIIFIISLFFNDLLKYRLIQKAFKGIACGVAVIITFAGIKLMKSFKRNWVFITLFILSVIVVILSEIKIINFSFITIVLIVFCGVFSLLCFKPKKVELKQKDDDTINNSKDIDKNIYITDKIEIKEQTSENKEIIEKNDIDNTKDTGLEEKPKENIEDENLEGGDKWWLF